MERGRPIDVDVQARRLEEEALKVRGIEDRLGSLNLKYENEIEAALRLVNRLQKHLMAALKARVLIVENKC
jgi:hypothetical protein